MLLAELNVRHTRRHQPTRRVALETAHVPTAGPAHGATLLATVVSTNLPALDDDARALLRPLLRSARAGIDIPRIALRHRLQRDLHGLELSRHRMFGEGGRVVVEVDMHGAAIPQVLGAVLAAAALPPSARVIALGAIDQVVLGRAAGLAPGVDLRFRWERQPGDLPPRPGERVWFRGARPEDHLWRGVPADQRWAMEVLGLRAARGVERGDVNRRFRRLLREAHPDHGAAAAGAAARITELTEARTILLGVASAGARGRG